MRFTAPDSRYAVRTVIVHIMVWQAAHTCGCTRALHEVSWGDWRHLLLLEYSGALGIFPVK